MNDRGAGHAVHGQGVLRDLESLACVQVCKKFPAAASTGERAEQGVKLRSGSPDYKACVLNPRLAKSRWNDKRWDSTVKHADLTVKSKEGTKKWELLCFEKFLNFLRYCFNLVLQIKDILKQVNIKENNLLYFTHLTLLQTSWTISTFLKNQSKMFIKYLSFA